MFFFILHVRSKGSFLYYDSIWDSVDATIHSVLGQDDDRFKVVVVSESCESRSYKDDDRVLFIDASFKEALTDNPGHTNIQYYSAPSTQLEKGCARASAFLQIKPLDPSYVMFLDVGDFVHESIVSRALSEKENPSGWVIKQGMVLRDFMFRSQHDIPSISDRSHILNFNTLTRTFDFDKLPSSTTPSFEEISTSLHPYYLRRILGGGGEYDAFFHNKNHPILEWAGSSIIYNMGYCSPDVEAPKIRQVGWHPVADAEGNLDFRLSGYNIREDFLRPKCTT